MDKGLAQRMCDANRLHIRCEEDTGMSQEKSDYELISEYYESYEQSAYSAAYSVLGNKWQAEEAVQETFLRIIQHRGTVRHMSEQKRRAYVMKTVRNIAIDMYRKNKRDSISYGGAEGRNSALTSRVEPGESRESVAERTKSEPGYDRGFAQADADYDRGFAQVENKELVNDILTKLREEDALILRLRVMRELSVRETAAIMCISEAAVRKRYERAIRKARKIIDREVE